MKSEQPYLPLFTDPGAAPGIPPSPPGDYIQKELNARDWSQADLARILGRPLPTINEIIKGKRGITPEMAVALGKAFADRPELWAHREAAYRLSLVKDAPDDDTARKAELFEKAPIKDMQRRGWISESAQTSESLSAELDRFFQSDVLQAVARQSRPNVEFSNAQRAWLCRAAALARAVSVRAYSRQRLEEALPKLRKLAALPERAAHLPIMLAELGVRLVVVEALPRTMIDGAAFFLDDDPTKPVIVLSLRIDRMESVWHTVGHELRHILRGDPLSIDSDLVGKDRQNQQEEMERIADSESANWLIPDGELHSFIQRARPHFAKERVVQFANRIGIHPSIIVGQLHHKGEIPWNKRNEMCPKVRDHFLTTVTSDGYRQ